METIGRKTVFDKDSLKILQLSDLHFSSEADATSTKSKHSHEYAEKLSEIVPTLDADLVIVSGDLTDKGDMESLLRVKEYIFSDYSVSGKKRIGLKLPEHRVRIIPGNHDAFNMPPEGTALSRVQKSLENYMEVFPNTSCKPCGCSYEWWQCKSWNAYLAFADSCFVGDPEWEQAAPKGIRYVDTTAKGKLALDQAEKLLSWNDQARLGRLSVNNLGSNEQLNPVEFTKSLKLLIMHHYLFEPRNYPSDHLMSFVERHDVFRNIGLADFDMLWCGHKHVADFAPQTYGEQMGSRGRELFPKAVDGRDRLSGDSFSVDEHDAVDQFL